MHASQEVSFSNIRASPSWSVRLPPSPMICLAPSYPVRLPSPVSPPKLLPTPGAAPSSPVLLPTTPPPVAALPTSDVTAPLPVRDYNVDLDATSTEEDMQTKLRLCQERLQQAEEREKKMKEENRGLIESVRNLTQSNLLLASQLSNSRIHEKETLMHIECMNSGIKKVRLTHMNDFSVCAKGCSHLKLNHSGIVKCAKL